MSPTITFFVHLQATSAWLRLSRREREDYVAQKLNPLLTIYDPIEFRFYDAESFTAKCSDIATFTTTDMSAFNRLMDDLRGSQLFTVPYFELVDIFPAVETEFV